ncbi:hypothetical protein [Exiguobacterium sp. JMULE1]|uniref:hypothetical protein n=1 Tax=Exiguobacterium sp. JMULE1 TaxID=2518339 RepID=UPI00157608B8|nr:hypothetical protein [Exiguobacterium sp. JMULE1]
MLLIENKGYGMFWVTEGAVTYVVGARNASEILNCTVEEVKKIMVATVEVGK